MIGAFMMGFAVPTIAQNDDKATIDQVNKIIKAKAPDAANQIKEIYKKNKKNPAVLTAIGRAYLDVKDTANASKYVQFAMEKSKQYGPAYILAGDIEVIKDNGGAASAWYEQATYFDPKNPEGYRKYAQINSKTSPSASVAKLEELRRQRPDYPVDVISAQIYDKAGNIKKAIEYYAKVDKNQMEDADLVSYSLDHFLLGEFPRLVGVGVFVYRVGKRDLVIFEALCDGFRFRFFAARDDRHIVFDKFLRVCAAVGFLFAVRIIVGAERRHIESPFFGAEISEKSDFVFGRF